jgi:hypothetical protein
MKRTLLSACLALAAVLSVSAQKIASTIDYAPVIHVGPWVSTGLNSAVTAGQSLRSEWKTFGNGPSHTGYFPDVLSLAQFASGWTASPGQNIHQVAVSGGRVFATPQQYFGQAWLAAFDETDGSPLWSYAFNSCYSINPPTFDGDHVYVQRGDHGTDTQLWSFHADNGVPFWIAPHSAQWEQYLAPTVADGKVWVNGGYYGGMYGFRQSDGVQLFFTGLEQYDEWTPTYYAGRVYSWVAGHMRAHSESTGVEQWSLNLGWNWAGWSMGRTSSMVNGRAYVVGNPNLYAIDISSHAVAWSVAGNFVGTPGVANGVVYAQTDAVVNAYDAWDGSYLGVYPGGPGLMDQPIVTDDAVLFSNSSTTFVYNRATFQSVATIPFGGHLSLAKGRLYIATATGLRTYQVIGSPAPQANLIAEWEPWTVGTVGNPHTAPVSIINYGSLGAPAYRVALLLSTDTKVDAGDTLLRLVTLPPLASGERRSALVEVTPSPALSNKYLLVVPDVAGIVSETNENNVSPSGKIP